MAVRCPLCNRIFRTSQGRRGHLNFYHGLAKETPFTKAIRWNIYRHQDGIKKLEEEQIDNWKKEDERREKAMSALRKYEAAMQGEEQAKQREEQAGETVKMRLHVPDEAELRRHQEEKEDIGRLSLEKGFTARAVFDSMMEEQNRLIAKKKEEKK